MAFIAEDGTGLANANSLATVEYADTYFGDRAITAWTGMTSAKQAALIKATDYIESRFARRFKEDKLVETQALSFPRTCYDMPDNVKRATCEYALRALKTDLAPDPTTDASGLRVASTTKVLGPLTKTTTYQNGSPDLLRAYPAADMLLLKYMTTRLSLIR